MDGKQLLFANLKQYQVKKGLNNCQYQHMAKNTEGQQMISAELNIEASLQSVTR